MIKIENLNKYFNKNKKNELHVLRDINLEFEEKGFVCILGESGSGKTTLLNTIGGLDIFSSGQIQVDEEIIKKYNPVQIEKVRNDKFGYIFQNYYLLQDYTVAYNVKLALNMYDISEEEKDSRVEYVLDALDMGRYKKKLVSQLSGGQQQRVSIARAIVKTPQIILADEPTGNLDEENTIRTMSILKNISRECLVILVSHEKRIAKFFADRIIEIKDGCIIKDKKNTPSEAYTRTDDSNIYLRELKSQRLESDFADIKVYSEKGTEKKIKLNFAWKDGKIYIQNLTDAEVVMEGEETGCRMLDEERPKLELEDVQNFEYKLNNLKACKEAKLPFREIWKMACENIKLMGKKQCFVMVILAVTTVLLSIELAEFMNRISVDEKDVIVTDSHYVQLDFKVPEYVFEADMDENIKDYMEQYVYKGKYSDYFINSGSVLSINYGGFGQLRTLKQRLEGFSWSSLAHLSQDDLICGTMPCGKDEIVVDRWILDNFIESGTNMTQVYKNIKDFIGTEFTAGANDSRFVIVGICDRGEPNVYVQAEKLTGLTVSGFCYASEDELKHDYPGEYDDIDLGDDEVLVSESEYSQHRFDDRKTMILSDDKEYNIVGTFPDEYAVDYVADEKICEELQKVYILYCKSVRIYTDDVDGAMAYFKDNAQKYEKYFELNVTCPYRQQLQEYKQQKKLTVGSKNLITLLIAIIAFVVVYFTIKSNVVSRSGELTVYRLIGISKKSIIHAYMLEMFLITTYTVFPAVLITSGVIRFIATVPSLEITLLFPVWSMFALIGIMYIINLLISAFPVNKIVSQPPAVLALRE